jgi:hypothetical protein
MAQVMQTPGVSKRPFDCVGPKKGFPLFRGDELGQISFDTTVAVPR